MKFTNLTAAELLKVCDRSDEQTKALCEHLEQYKKAYEHLDALIIDMHNTAELYGEESNLCNQ